MVLVVSFIPMEDAIAWYPAIHVDDLTADEAGAAGGEI